MEQCPHPHRLAHARRHSAHRRTPELAHVGHCTPIRTASRPTWAAAGYLCTTAYEDETQLSHAPTGRYRPCGAVSTQVLLHFKSFQKSTQGYQRSLCPSRNTQRAAAAPRSNTQQSSQRRQLAMASSLINAPRGGETGGTINRILSTSRYLNTGGRQSFLGTSTASSTPMLWTLQAPSRNDEGRNGQAQGDGCDEK